MAGPRIFVPGPSVNPGLIGSPAQYLANIAAVSRNRRNSAIAKERTENQKLFNDARLAQQQEKLDFDIAAPERARAEAEFQREQNTERALARQGVIDASGGSLVDSFIANPEAQAFFASRPEFANNPEAQRAAVEAYAAQNKSLFSDPTKLREQVYRGVLAENGTDAEARAAADRAVSEMFPTLSDDLAGKLFAKPGAGGGTSLSSLIKAANGKSSSGSSTPLQGIPNQAAAEELNRQLEDRINVESGDRATIPGTDFRLTDFLDHDLTRNDVTLLEGEFSQELRPETIRRALIAVANPKDGTVKFNPADMSPQERADFLQIGRGIEAKANEPRGGGRIFGGNGVGLSAQDIIDIQTNEANARNAFNSDILSRTSPRANTFEERLSGFTNSLGIPAVQSAGGVTAPANDTPTQADTTGSATLDSLITPSAAEVEQVQQPAAVGPPGRDGSVFQTAESVPVTQLADTDIQAEVNDAESRISIFGNGTKEDKDIIAKGNKELKKRADTERVSEIEAELQEMPRPEQRTLAQVAYARSLEKELRDLKR